MEDGWQTMEDGWGTKDGGRRMVDEGGWRTVDGGGMMKWGRWTISRDTQGCEDPRAT